MAFDDLFGSFHHRCAVAEQTRSNSIALGEERVLLSVGFLFGFCCVFGLVWFGLVFFSFLPPSFADWMPPALHHFGGGDLLGSDELTRLGQSEFYRL